MGPKELSMDKKNIRKRERYKERKLLKAAGIISGSSNSDLETNAKKIKDAKEKVLNPVYLKSGRGNLTSNEDLSAMSSNEDTKSKRKLPAFNRIITSPSVVDATTSEDERPRKRRKGKLAVFDSDDTSDIGKQPSRNRKSSGPANIEMNTVPIKEVSPPKPLPRREVSPSKRSPRRMVSGSQESMLEKKSLIFNNVEAKSPELVINPVISKPKRKRGRPSNKDRVSLHPSNAEVNVFSSMSDSMPSSDTDNIVTSNQRKSSRRSSLANIKINTKKPESLPNKINTKKRYSMPNNNLCPNPFSRSTPDVIDTSNKRSNKKRDSISNRNDAAKSAKNLKILPTIEINDSDDSSDDKDSLRSAVTTMKNSPKKGVNRALEFPCTIPECTNDNLRSVDTNIKKSPRKNLNISSELPYTVSESNHKGQHMYIVNIPLSNENNNLSMGVPAKPSRKRRNQRKKTSPTIEKLPIIKYPLSDRIDNELFVNFIKKYPQYSAYNFRPVVVAEYSIKIDQLLSKRSEFSDECAVEIESQSLISEDHLEGLDEIPDELMSIKIEPDSETEKDDFGISDVCKIKVVNICSLADPKTIRPGKKVKLNRNFEELNPPALKTGKTKFKINLESIVKLTSNCDMFVGATLADSGISSPLITPLPQHFDPKEAANQLMIEVQKELAETIPDYNQVKVKEEKPDMDHNIKENCTVISSDDTNDSDEESRKKPAHEDKTNKSKKDFSRHRSKYIDLVENESNTEDDDKKTKTDDHNTSRKRSSSGNKEKGASSEPISTKNQDSPKKKLPKKGLKLAESSGKQTLDNQEIKLLDQNSDNSSKKRPKSTEKSTRIKDSKLCKDDTPNNDVLKNRENVEKKLSSRHSSENRGRREHSLSEETNENELKTPEKIASKYLDNSSAQLKESDEELSYGSSKTENTIKGRRSLDKKRSRSSDKSFENSSLKQKHPDEDGSPKNNYTSTERKSLDLQQSKSPGKNVDKILNNSSLKGKHSDEELSHGSSKNKNKNRERKSLDLNRPKSPDKIVNKSVDSSSLHAKHSDEELSHGSSKNKNRSRERKSLDLNRSKSPDKSVDRSSLQSKHSDEELSHGSSENKNRSKERNSRDLKRSKSPDKIVDKSVDRSSLQSKHSDEELSHGPSENKNRSRKRKSLDLNRSKSPDKSVDKSLLQSKHSDEELSHGSSENKNRNKERKSQDLKRSKSPDKIVDKSVDRSSLQSKHSDEELSHGSSENKNRSKERKSRDLKRSKSPDKIVDKSVDRSSLQSIHSDEELSPRPDNKNRSKERKSLDLKRSKSPDKYVDKIVDRSSLQSKHSDEELSHGSSKNKNRNRERKSLDLNRSKSPDKSVDRSSVQSKHSDEELSHENKNRRRERKSLDLKRSKSPDKIVNKSVDRSSVQSEHSDEDTIKERRSLNIKRLKYPDNIVNETLDNSSLQLKHSDEELSHGSSKNKNRSRERKSLDLNRSKSPDNMLNRSSDNSDEEGTDTHKQSVVMQNLHNVERTRSKIPELRRTSVNSDEKFPHRSSNNKELIILNNSRSKSLDKIGKSVYQQRTSEVLLKPLEKLSKPIVEKQNEFCNKKINGYELMTPDQNSSNLRLNPANRRSNQMLKIKQEPPSPGKKINLIRPVIAAEEIKAKRTIYVDVKLEESEVTKPRLDNGLDNRPTTSDLRVKDENDVTTRLGPKVLLPNDLREKINSNKIKLERQKFHITLDNDIPSTSGFQPRPFNRIKNESPHLKNEIIADTSRNDTSPSIDRHKFKFVDQQYEIKRPPKLRLGPPVNVRRQSHQNRRLQLDEDSISIFANSCFVDLTNDFNDEEENNEEDDEETSSNEFLKQERVEGWVDDCIDSTDGSRINDDELDEKKPRIKEEFPNIDDTNDRYNAFNYENIKMKPETPVISSLMTLPCIEQPKFVPEQKFIPERKFVPEQKFIPFFKLCCSWYMKERLCKRLTTCKFLHGLPNNWIADFQNLSIDYLMQNYRFYRDGEFSQIYKDIFPVIAQQLGIQKDFNNLTTLVRDVLQIKLNTAKAPFINHVINALLTTGWTFPSTVEFVFMSVTVDNRLTNLLCDVLLNLTIEKKNFDEHWNVIIMLSKFKNYNVDNGIIKSIITDVLAYQSTQKEFVYKLYHDLIKMISNQCLKYISTAVIPEYIELLRKHNLNSESDEFESRCIDLGLLNPRVIDSTQSSPVSKTNSSGSVTTVPEVNPNIQSPHDVIFTPNTSIPPLIRPKQGLLHHPTTGPILPVSNIWQATQPNFQSPHPPFRPQRHAAPVRPPPPQSWKVPAPYIPQSCAPRPRFQNQFGVNISRPFKQIPDRVPSYPLPTYQQQPLLPTPNHEQQQQQAYNTEQCVVQPAEIDHILQAVGKENVSDILGQIMNFKDNMHIDVYLKILITALLRTTHNYPTFFNTLGECAVIYNNKSPSLDYVLKTIGVNLLLHLIDIREYDKAFLINKILLTSYKGDIYNVKLYIDKKYTYGRKILAVARLCLLKQEPILAWTILREHTALWQQTQDAAEKKETVSVFTDLFKLISQVKHWNIGMTILSYWTKVKIQGIDLAAHADDIIVNAINSECTLDRIREFISSNQGWYCFIKPTTFRAIVVRAMKLCPKLASELHAVGQRIEVYPDFIGNEGNITISSFYIYEEIQLMIEHLLQKMVFYKPIKYPFMLTIAINEDPNLMSESCVPKCLQQFNITADDIRARVSNILTNFLRPPILVRNAENHIYIDRYTLNQHLDAKSKKQ